MIMQLWKIGTTVLRLKLFMGNGLKHAIVLKKMCSNTLKFITIENDFIRCLVTNHLHHLRSKKWLSNVSDFLGQDQKLGLQKKRNPNYW